MLSYGSISSAPLSSLTMGVMAPPVDTTGPLMVGSITVGPPTSSGATLSWLPATDDVGTVGYEYRINGGAYNNFGAGRVLTISGLPSATSATVDVRAYDLAGNRGAPLTATFTTTTGQAMQFTPSDARTLTATVSSTTPFAAPGAGGFWNVTSNPKRPVGTKDPDATIDITLDWSPVFTDIADTIRAGSGVVIPGAPGLGVPALVDAGSEVVGTKQTVFLSGGTTAGDYPVTFRVSSASTPPRIFDRTIIIKVEDQ